MILHTVLPIEQVLEGMDQERRFTEMTILGVTLIVEAVSADMAVIVRIVSTDPRDYLNPALEPGRTVRLAPALEGMA